jgi:hypothetical protein
MSRVIGQILPLLLAGTAGVLADPDRPLLDLAERQEDEARRKAVYEANAAKIREERLARKRAAFEKRRGLTPRQS